jgi:DNA-binding NarL/FixJ family response regulator
MANDIDVVSATENIDLNSVEGRALFGVMSALNASYREAASERIRDAQATRAEEGYPLGHPPFGWMNQNKAHLEEGQRRGFQPHPAQRETVLWIKEQYLSGVNCVNIAGALNKRGVTSAKGCRWSAGAVMSVLKNPLHAGYVNSRRKGLIRGQHYEQRFYDLEVWQEIMALCQRRLDRWKTNSGKAKTPHLINGTAICARCGRRLYIANTTASYRNYRCQTGANQGQRTCPEVSVRAETLEEAVVNEIKRLAAEPQVRALLLQEAASMAKGQDQQLENEKKRLQKAQKENKERLKRLLDALGRGTLDDAAYQSGSASVRTEQSALEEQLAAIQTQLDNRSYREVQVNKLSAAVLDFALCWEHLQMNEKRLMLSTLIEKLTVDRHGRDVTLTIKVHLLSERTVTVLVAKPHHSKPKLTGVQSLTPRELLYLHYVSQGKKVKEIAALMGITVNNTYQFTKEVRESLGVWDIQKAAEMAQERIQSILDNFPAGSKRSRGMRGDALPLLSDALLEILPLLAKGAKPKEIAKMRDLPLSTVLGRRKRLLEALGAETDFEAGERARALGLLQDQPQKPPA